MDIGALHARDPRSCVSIAVVPYRVREFAIGSISIRTAVQVTAARRYSSLAVK